ncbi:MAG: hypothetical protein KDK70_11000 [Myxococcales bacterium]|nr:hypothetical protein [Myxococcales bacterium]
MGPRLTLAILVLLTGCSDHGASTRPDVASPSASPAATTQTTATTQSAEHRGEPDRTTPAERWAEPPVSHLLAVHHDDTRASARTTAVELATPGPVAGDERSWPALPLERWPGHFTFPASHDGGPHYAVARPDGERFSLVWAAVGDAAADRTVDLGPRAPAALLVAGTHVLAGIDNIVGEADFEPPVPTFRELHTRPEMPRGKAYDLLTRTGDWVIAIDDIVMPIYADGLRLGPGGRARHEVGFELPGAINGTYRYAALHRTGPDTGVLYAIVSYGIMDGSGQDLARLPVEGGRTTSGFELILNSGGHPNVLEEHVDRGTGKPTALTAGSTFTPWTGLALLEDPAGLRHVLLAAGARGLLVLDPEVGPTTKAETIELGGPCYDVRAVGARVFALVEGAVVELHTVDGHLREHARASMPAGFAQWAR